MSNSIIGMVHTGALPGTPKNSQSLKNSIEKSVHEAEILASEDVDAVRIEKYWNLADAFIVGSSFKESGKWENDVNRENVKQFMKKITELRNNHGI